MLRRLGAHHLRVKRFRGALIPAPGMPEIGMVVQVSPFLVVGRRNRMADITTERDAVGVVGGTKLPAVEFSRWCIEAVVKLLQVKYRNMHGLIVSGLSKVTVTVVLLPVQSDTAVFSIYVTIRPSYIRLEC